MQQTGSLGIGGLTRCLSVAFEAYKRGHKVAFYGRTSILNYLSDFIVEFFEAPTPEPSNNQSAKNFRLADSILIRNMHDYAFIKASVKRELDVIKKFAPDLIFTENHFSASISASVASVPLITTVASVNLPHFSSPLYEEKDSAKGVEENFNKIFKYYGLPEVENISELSYLRSTLNIAPTIPEFEPDLANIPNTIYVGSLLYPLMEVGRLPSELVSLKDIVYVYMSVGKLTPEKYIPILSSVFRSLELHGVIVLRGGGR